MDETPQNQWQFWVDRGGTFTDIVALRPDGQLVTHKLLSENPDHYQDAALAGIHYLQEQYSQFSDAIAAVKMGTTVATNALLERKGDDTLLLISRGLRDQLQIGYQTRSDIFAVDIKQSLPLYKQVIEVPERVLADGTIELPLDMEAAMVQLQLAFQQGFRSVAIVLMHSYKYPRHEQQLAGIANAVGFQQISVSHQISPLIKLVPRGATTLVDAYLSPVLRRYVNQVDSALVQHQLKQSLSNRATLQFMQSNGGLVDASQFRGRDAVLSGPAGGVIGMVKTALADGFDKLIGFDMGGTSTDVSHYGGELERKDEALVNGARLRVPMMDIHTVAAGGGSIVRFDDGRLQVGPESAGAMPGPACYRNGGPLTITDCNVLLGRVRHEFFPKIFGPDQNQALDTDGVRHQFTLLAQQVSEQTGIAYTAETLAEGFLTIAIENMAAAVKKISVQRGHDIQDYCLSAFGGAGGQHACAVADALNIKQVYLHPLAGVLSAYGIGIADQRWLEDVSIEVSLPLAHTAFEQGYQQLKQRCKQHMVCLDDVELQLRGRLRYIGSDTSLLVNWPVDLPYVEAIEQVQQAFEQQHKELFGFYHAGQSPHIDALQLEAQRSSAVSVNTSLFSKREQNAEPSNKTTVSVYCDSSMLTSSDDQLNEAGYAADKGVGWHNTPIFQRSQLSVGDRHHGPCLIMDDTSTIWVDPGWHLTLVESGALLLTKQVVEHQQQESNQELNKALSDAPSQSSLDCCPIKLEIYNNVFMAIAEQMGFVLEKTASSVNIKERLDFSCAIFDRYGELVANAPHIPVHLGSMSESIKTVIREHPDMQAGDAFVLNTPYNGGTHLPDITVVKPVFAVTANKVTEAGSSAPDFYVAARGHHADIGGITPGSMPAESTHIEQEGVMLDNLVLMRGGELQQQAILDVLTQGPYPARNPQQNISDLQAQLAACEKGVSELTKLCQRSGTDEVHHYMQFVQDNAEQSLRQCLANLSDGDYQLFADDDSCYRVAVTVDQEQRTAIVDFTGTGYRPDQPMHPGNFNAPRSVVTAAVLYGFRLLVGKNIPLNAGFLRALTIKVPPASMVSPEYPAAVVSGNVETAQCLVNCLLAALGVMANSQGTNNNLTFGNDCYQYYETIGGGAGASATAAGGDAVHTHMTNSRLTDPEVLEQRFPVVLDHFHIRSDSGGRGRYRGGHGLERHIRFLEPMEVNIISGQRRHSPEGLDGGHDAVCGENFIFRQGASIDFYQGCVNATVKAGDTVCIHTPGGGGYGAIGDDE